MLDKLIQGGWVMIPLLLCSLAAVAIVCERLLALRRTRILDNRILRLIQEFQGNGSVEAAMVICRRANGPLARIIEDVLAARELGHADAIENLHASGRTQVGEMERGLTLLEIVGSVSPLLGLLGTVLGMITVFDAITSEGVGNPQVLSDGISKALITTVAGLSVAIPAVVCHSWLRRRVEDLAVEMQDLAMRFLTKLQLGKRNGD